MEELIDAQAKAQEVIEAQDGWEVESKWKSDGRIKMPSLVKVRSTNSLGGNVASGPMSLVDVNPDILLFG